MGLSIWQIMIVGVFLLPVYFIPAIVAAARGHTQKWPIFWLNVLLGWTFLGWVASLVWAVSNFRKSD